MSRPPAERLLSAPLWASHVPRTADHPSPGAVGTSQAVKREPVGPPWLNQTSSNRPGVQCVTNPTGPLKLEKIEEKTRLSSTLTLMSPVWASALKETSNHWPRRPGYGAVSLVLTNVYPPSPSTVFTLLNLAMPSAPNTIS